MSLMEPRLGVDSVAAPEDSAASPHLFGPVSDFLMLGGVSLLLFPLLALLPTEAVRPGFVTGVFLVSLAVNYPHFAVSYRIFYEGFVRKASPGNSGDATLHLRYLFAGVVAPIVVVAAMAIPMAAGNPEVMGYAFNAMGFFVGWHYVKQGYGMAMVDAAKKKLFFAAHEKKLLLVNGYAIWFLAWSIPNSRGGERPFMGFDVKLFDLPDLLVALLVVAGIVSTVATAAVLARRLLDSSPTAWTGVVAYLTSLYLWSMLVHANQIIALVAPALHSLQYLYVVKRYQTNRHHAGAAQHSWRSQYWRSVGLGLLMFLVIPVALDKTVGYDEVAFGALPFSFMFMIAINVHHYFLDNVMWRRGNPDVSEHLFA